jgi:hypothetical protein
LEIADVATLGDIEQCEKAILCALSLLGIVSPDFTGSVTLHIHQGRISDLEKTEKSIKKRLSRM